MKRSVSEPVPILCQQMAPVSLRWPSSSYTSAHRGPSSTSEYRLSGLRRARGRSDYRDHCARQATCCGAETCSDSPTPPTGHSTVKCSASSRIEERLGSTTETIATLDTSLAPLVESTIIDLKACLSTPAMGRARHQAGR